MSDAEASAVRVEFLTVLNEHRVEEGSSNLRSSPELTAIAQQQAENISASVADGAASQLSLGSLTEQGYQAKRMVQIIANSLGDPGLVVERWAVNNPVSYGSFLASEIRDMGIGISELNHMPLYFLLAAQPMADHENQVAESLADLSRIRSELLEQVNAEREQVGLKRLKIHLVLNLTAQRYAENMLARGFYGHVSPDGRTALDRARATGYDQRRVGENLSNGAESVDEVMTGWMNSPGHRKNILSRRFHDIGLGLAVGRGPEGFQILWVQVFGG